MRAYALMVQMPRSSNGRQALSSVSRTIASNRGTANEMITALGLVEDFDFLMASDEITAVEIDRNKITSARFNSLTNTVNGCVIGNGDNLSAEFGGLINTQRELYGDRNGAAKVFLEVL